MSHEPFPTAGNVDNAVFPLKSPDPENSPFADTLHYEAGDAIGFGLEINEEIPFPDAGEFTQPAVTGIPHVDENSDAERPEVPRAAAAPAQEKSDEEAKADADAKAAEKADADKKAAEKAVADKADADKKAADEAKAKAADEAKAEDAKVVAPKAATKG